MDRLELIQWVALACAIIGSFCIAFNSKYYRRMGFSFYLVSNAAWFIAGNFIPSRPIMTQSVIFSVLAIFGIINSLGTEECEEKK